jgi:hypothetical protein
MAKRVPAKHLPKLTFVFLEHWKAYGHFAAQAIFHASASIVREVPMVMEAVYRDRESGSAKLGRAHSSAKRSVSQT